MFSTPETSVHVLDENCEISPLQRGIIKLNKTSAPQKSSSAEIANAGCAQVGRLWNLA